MVFRRWSAARFCLPGVLALLALPSIFGYVERRGVFTNVNVPGTSLTSIRGINLFGLLVGTFGDVDGNLHGFVRGGATFSWTFPGPRRPSRIGSTCSARLPVFLSMTTGMRTASS